MDALLDAPRGRPIDWGAVVALCDTLNAGSARDAAAAVQVLCVRLDAAQRARVRARGLSGTAEERAVRALVLLDSLVKNVGAARAVAAAKSTLALLERVADLKSRTASARASRERHKRRAAFTATSGSSSSEEAAAILGEEDAETAAEEGGSSSGSSSDGDAAERAMRLIQTWGMLHPAEFPLYLRAVERWKTAGVVFPPATPEDLLPLPPCAGSSAAGGNRGTPTAGGNGTQGGRSDGNKDKDGDGNDDDGRGVLTSVVLQLCDVACDTAALLADVCAAAADADADADAAVDTADVRATLVAQCRDMRTAMAAVVEAALVGRSLPPVTPGGPRVLVYRSGAHEAARERAVAFLLGVVERLDTAVAAAESPVRHGTPKEEERTKDDKEDDRKDEVFNPFNLPESVVRQSASAAPAPAAAPVSAPVEKSAAAPKKTSYLDELLGTAPAPQEGGSGAAKHDALADLLSS